jgi:tetratricopeptide (TPR) repeat protein
MPLFRQALTILEEDPDRPQDRERWEKIHQVIVDFERTGEEASTGPAALLPPMNSLSPEGWDDLGMQLVQSHPLQAKICFERAAVGRPERALFWLHLAMCLGVVGAPQQDVISAYAQVIMRDAGEWRGWIGLASSLQEAARFDEAVAAWDKTLEVVPHKDHPLRQRAFCVEAHALQVRGQTWDAKAWHAEGSRQLDAKQWNLSDFAFSRALEMAPVYPGALMGKGLANFHWATELKLAGNSASILRFRIAKDALDRALALRPEAPGVSDVIAECQNEILAAG